MKTWKIVLIAVVLAIAGLVIGGVMTYFFIASCQDSSKPKPSGEYQREGKPNVIIFFADDTGYADFQSFGHPTQEWTGIDRMVKEGMKFTSFYSPVSVCSPSRAAILTGRYPIRSGIFGDNLVFAHTDPGGLPKKEVTIAEALKDVGYATGMVGKWHLGINEFNSTDGSHLPKHHGFDYVGTNLPFSQAWACDPEKYTVEQMDGQCFLYESDKIIEQPINLTTLTSRLLRDTKHFISENHDRPFFFYFSFPQTHAAMFSDPRFAGSSRRGEYGDNVNEMGWAVNEVLDHLIELGIEKDTFAIFLSDHGPMLDYCGEGGESGIFVGGKLTTWEGGVRVPAVAWWPGTINASTVTHTVLNTMDILPTALQIAGNTDYFSKNKIFIDGKPMTEILKGESTLSPHKALFFYCSEILTAVRYGKHKIHYYTLNLQVDDIVIEARPACDYINVTATRSDMACSKNVEKQDPPMVFDIEADPGEHIRLNPDKAETKRLLEIVDDLVQSHKASIIPVKSEIDKVSTAELGPCCNPPSCICNYGEGSPIEKASPM